MLATVQELTRLIPPPTRPVDARGDWDSVETALGLKLPTDYKQIIETYGTGKFFRWLWVFSPFVVNERWSLSFQVQQQSLNFRTYRDEGFRVPYPEYPFPGGLVCFGTTENNNCLSWVATGAPDKWGLAIWDTDYLTMWPFPKTTLGSLLVQLAKGVNLETEEGPLLSDFIFENRVFVTEDYDTPPFYNYRRDT